ncbi:carbamate kinase [Cutibacterium sp. WCA-380-WT-3A]|uniref:Carbamate kinase n=1 Tax=Cutibacterium porci TaxID=2605781 RepID=A0A7K0J9Q2_9ACTN|nr:carbamate kinase [Cutibacterium porci]MSS46707.1 carbamate kinase [Cutibacterium porci]
MRILIALGGNALLRRGETMTAENQRANVRIAAERIKEVAVDHEVVVAHGNGPQVGLLALQSTAYEEVGIYPLDVLGAESQAMIGYMIEQELGNVMPKDQQIVSMITMTVVDGDDPAFEHPTKPIGPVYDQQTAERLAAQRGWTVARDGQYYRRVVPSPQPRNIVEQKAIRQLVDSGVLVVCAGGGGVPCVFDEDGRLHGVEAVIDKDLASAELAVRVGADVLVIATDVAGVFNHWGEPNQERIELMHAREALDTPFAAGSMGPKVQAACNFALATGNRAVIGSLEDIQGLVNGTHGTTIVA